MAKRKKKTSFNSVENQQARCISNPRSKGTEASPSNTGQQNLKPSSSSRDSNDTCQTKSTTTQHERPQSASNRRRSNRRRNNAHFNSRRNRQTEDKHHKHNENVDSQEHTHKNTASCSASASEPPDESSESDTNVLEIPGFYFDKEKKKYFKILPGNVNANAGVVTREKIAEQKAEEKRKINLKKLEAKTKSKITNLLFKPEFGKTVKSVASRRVDYSNNLYDCIESRRHISQTFQCVRHKVAVNRTSMMHPMGQRAILDTPHALEHVQHLCPCPSGDRLLGVWSVPEMLTQKMLLLNINSISRTEEDKLKVDMDCKTLGLVMGSKITSICWAPESSQSKPCRVVTTSVGYLSNNASLVKLKHLSNCCDENHDDTPVLDAEFNLFQKALWCSAWNCSEQKFSVGTENCSLMVDPERRSMWEFNTQGSDVFAQIFAGQGGRNLYSGTKMGSVFNHDVRSSSTLPVMTLKLKCGVCHLKLCHHNRYLFTHDFKGWISQWDLRQRALVKRFKSSNQYSRLSVCVDESETLIYSVGADSYTRLWDMSSGEMLQSIPPPYQASLDSIPAVYLTHDRSRHGFPGVMLMAAKDSMYFYL